MDRDHLAKRGPAARKLQTRASAEEKKRRVIVILQWGEEHIGEAEHHGESDGCTSSVKLISCSGASGKQIWRWARAKGALRAMLLLHLMRGEWKKTCQLCQLTCQNCQKRTVICRVVFLFFELIFYLTHCTGMSRMLFRTKRTSS